MNTANIHENSKDFHRLETTGLTQTATMTLKRGDATSDQLEPNPRSDQIVVVLDGEIVAEVDGERGVLCSGTLAGMEACDVATGAKNSWRGLFTVERKTLSATWDYLREKCDYPFYFAKGHLAGAESKELAGLSCGEGTIVRVEGRKAAAFLDDKGRAHVLSPICPRLGCVGAWNEAERPWNCPSRGSRFQAIGELIGGPAERTLERLKP